MSPFALRPSAVQVRRPAPSAAVPRPRQRIRWVLGLVGFALLGSTVGAATYFVDPERGDDAADGTRADAAWRSLARVGRAALQPGDRVALAGGVRHMGSLHGEGWAGTAENPIVLTSYRAGGGSGGGDTAPAIVDGRGTPAAIHLRNCRQVIVENLHATADGGGWPDGRPGRSAMRCGVLIEYDQSGEFAGVALRGVQVRDVSFADRGFVRPADDVRTANGTIRYGWGIRFLVHTRGTVLRDVSLQNCRIERVDHTGLKFTAPADGIRDLRVRDVSVSDVGGPGVQMSGVTGGHVVGISVDRSGSASDTRHWGRGSGLWTWETRDVVIEHSRFTNANGPGDSAGVHIDYRCRNVIVQYNLSANNAGGFLEILGDNHQCAYRYNVSVNDGRRVKGREGAFQEGKIFWLSGYVGPRTRPTGPFNSYCYNNTIFVGPEIEPRVAVAPTAAGVLVANNIFHFHRPARVVTGDQLQTDQATRAPVKRVIFAHNLFLHADDWPAGSGLESTAAIIGDPRFARPGGWRLEDYVPREAALVKDRGLPIPVLPGDTLGLKGGLAVQKDILGRPIVGPPDLGAIELP